MLVCGLLLLLGLVAAVRWGGKPFASPEISSHPSAGEVARRFAWYSSILLTSGVLAGLTVIGGGGRLAMRLLAVTGGDTAQGRITEAEEVVGRITVDGTIGFVLFNGIFGGVIAATIYLLVRRLLPDGRLGGIAFGLGLLVVLGATIDPLRRDNPDFDIVGPGWLAVAVFTALALVFGAALHGTAARLSAWLPLPSRDRGTMLRYAAPAVLAAVAFSLTAFLIVIGGVVVVATRWQPLAEAVRSRRVVLGGRLLAVGVAVASLPNALSSVADIAAR